MTTIEILNGHTEEEINAFDYQFNPNGYGEPIPASVHFLGSFYNCIGETVGSFRADTIADIHELFDKFYSEMN